MKVTRAHLNPALPQQPHVTLGMCGRLSRTTALRPPNANETSKCLGGGPPNAKTHCQHFFERLSGGLLCCQQALACAKESVDPLFVRHCGYLKSEVLAQTSDTLLCFVHRYNCRTFSNSASFMYAKKAALRHCPASRIRASVWPLSAMSCNRQRRSPRRARGCDSLNHYLCVPTPKNMGAVLARCGNL